MVMFPGGGGVLTPEKDGYMFSRVPKTQNLPLPFCQKRGQFSGLHDTLLGYYSQDVWKFYTLCSAGYQFSTFKAKKGGQCSTFKAKKGVNALLCQPEICVKVYQYILTKIWASGQFFTKTLGKWSLFGLESHKSGVYSLPSQKTGVYSLPFWLQKPGSFRESLPYSFTMGVPPPPGNVPGEVK